MCEANQKQNQLVYHYKQSKTLIYQQGQEDRSFNLKDICTNLTDFVTCMHGHLYKVIKGGQVTKPIICSCENVVLLTITDKRDFGHL